VKVGVLQKKKMRVTNMRQIMKSLDAIEKHHNIILPDGYKKWSLKGYTNYKSDLDEYLWVNEAEWIPPEDVLSRDLGRDKVLCGIIPFAFTGAGDHWCFNTSQKTEDAEYQILACWHDEVEAELYAPNFKAWFYRTCLEYASSVENKPDEIKNAQENLILWSNHLREIEGEKWANHLADLAESTPFEYKDPKLRSNIILFGFVTSMDAEKIIYLEMGEKYTGETVEWGWDTDT